MLSNSAIDVNLFYGQQSHRKTRKTRRETIGDENDKPPLLQRARRADQNHNCREDRACVRSDSTQKFYSNCFPQNSHISAQEVQVLHNSSGKTTKALKDRQNSFRRRLNGGNAGRWTPYERDRGVGSVRVNMRDSHVCHSSASPLRESRLRDEKGIERKSGEKITNFFEATKRQTCSPVRTPKSTVPEEERTPVLLSQTNNLRLNDSNEYQMTPKVRTSDESLAKSALLVTCEAISDSDTILEPNRPIGLKNLGNTCYMNSMVQSIFALKFFIGDLEQKFEHLDSDCERTRDLKKDFSMTSRLLKLYKQYNGLRNGVKDCSFEELINSLLDLKASVGQKSTPFLSGSQQDGAEFFTHVIDSIAEEFESIKDFESHNNPIWRNFGFETGGSLTCKRCRNRSGVERERFHALYLSIPEDNSLETALHHFLKDETTGHQCVASDCVANENLLSKYFTKLSKVLFLQLGRYTEDGLKRTEQVLVPPVIELPVKVSGCVETIAPSPLATPYRSKLQNLSIGKRVAKVVRKISFETSSAERSEQNISNELKFCSENSFDSENERTEEMDAKEENELRHRYRLVAVVCHHGHTLAVGHYTAYVYSIESDQWFKCDDNSVSLTDFESVRRKSQTSGYCYFYVHT